MLSIGAELESASGDYLTGGSTNQVLTRGEPPARTPFLLIAVPDATMTLDSLASALAPLLAKHPDGGLLLLGLPGLPHTIWPRGLPLTADHQV